MAKLTQFFSGWHSSKLTSRQHSMLLSFFTGSLRHMDTSSIFQTRRCPCDVKSPWRNCKELNVVGRWAPYYVPSESIPTHCLTNPFFSGWHSSKLTSRQRSMLRSFFTGSLHHMDTSSSGRSKRPPGWIWGFLQAVDTVARYVDCKSTTTWESALLNAY